MSEAQVEVIIDHIKTALGPVPWEARRFCETCEYELLINEDRQCSECSVKA